MKRICCWNDLNDFGIKPLTGEACGLTYRLLCDLNERGKRTIEKCFDVKLELAEPWNSGAVGSIMLAPEVLMPIGIFALLESGCTEVWRQGDTIIGIDPSDADELVQTVRRESAWRFAYEGTAGSRNRHEFTGRVL